MRKSRPSSSEERSSDRKRSADMTRHKYKDRKGKESPEKKKIKNQRYVENELRILIPSEAAGTIIGKGGNNIERLRSENKVTIMLPDSFGPERILSICSDHYETSLNVLMQIVPFMDEDVYKENTRRSTDGTDSAQEVRLLFHKTHAGCIIGKGGERIKELQIVTKTHMKVYSNCCPRSTDRVVALTGPVDKLPTAIRQIITLTNEDPVKCPTKKYDARDFDSKEAIQYGGFGGGDLSASSNTGHSMNRGRGGEGSRQSRADDRSGHSHNDSGHGRGRSSKERVHRNPVENANRIGHHARQNHNVADEDKITTKVTIPNPVAGSIIGTGGSNIRRIRAESGADITIGDLLPKEANRIITIAGTDSQIQMAVYLLQKTVKENIGRRS